MHIYAQGDNSWYPYYSSDSSMYGFKNSRGEKMTEPKFEIVNMIRKMDHIVSILEFDSSSEKFDMYYLLKDGREIGRDSVLINDAQFPCESEGLINFIDKKTELQGCFNADGFIQIPPTYNYIGLFHNGYAVALIGAKKKYWDHNHKGGCNHWSWEGGEKVLIDKSNNIVIRHFNEKDIPLDLYSLVISDSPLSNPYYEIFEATSQRYYHFLNVNKTFESFFFKEFLIKSDNPIFYFKVVNHWNDEIGEWVFDTSVTRKDFIVKDILPQLQDISQWEYDISATQIITDIEYEKYFEPYMDNCYRHNQYKYPLLEIRFKHIKNDKRISLEFIRTELGYQLASFNF